MLLFSDGFDSYSATGDLTKKWLTAASPWAFVSNGGRTGGGCLQAATTGAAIIKPVSAGFSANATACFAFWFKCSAAPSVTAAFLQVRNAVGAILSTLRVTNLGKFNLLSQTSSSLATGSVNVCDGNEHWVELYLNIGSSVLNRLTVDSLSEWNASLSTTSGATAIDSFELVSITGVTVTIDDFFVWDDSAGAPQLAQYPLGPRQITTVRPQADSVVSFATATGGSTHYNQVNETTGDGDATYVESSSSGDQDLYDFAAMGVSPATITAVMANAYVENPNPGAISLKQIVKSGSTQTDGTAVQAPASYRIVQQPFPIDPNTSAAWANSTAVDAATFGVKVA